MKDLCDSCSPHSVDYTHPFQAINVLFKRRMSSDAFKINMLKINLFAQAAVKKCEQFPTGEVLLGIPSGRVKRGSFNIHIDLRTRGTDRRKLGRPECFFHRSQI